MNNFICYFRCVPIHTFNTLPHQKSAHYVDKKGTYTFPVMVTGHWGHLFLSKPRWWKIQESIKTPEEKYVSCHYRIISTQTCVFSSKLKNKKDIHNICSFCNSHPETVVLSLLALLSYKQAMGRGQQVHLLSHQIFYSTLGKCCFWFSYYKRERKCFFLKDTFLFWATFSTKLNSRRKPICLFSQ